jgi:putative SOS response-associated peptidase YedK
LQDCGTWKPDGKKVESLTIITTEPNELIEPIHNRMPVIFRPEDEEQWLDSSRIPFVKAKSLLKPYPEELWMPTTFHQSSTRHSTMARSVQPLAEDETPRAGQLSLS